VVYQRTSRGVVVLNLSTRPVVIDIETANLGPGTPGSRVNPEDWQIACVGVYDSLSDTRYVFLSFPEVVRLEGDPDVNDYLFNLLHHNLLEATTADQVLPLTELASLVEEWALSGRHFLTHRGHTFDWPILGHHLGLDEAYKNLDLGGQLLDTHAYIEQQTGLNCSLESLIKASLGPQEGKLMQGKDAPLKWQQGIQQFRSTGQVADLALVIDYCLDDVVKTFQVFKRGLNFGVLDVVPRGASQSVVIALFDWGLNL